MRFVGDIHGKVQQYYDLVKDTRSSLQIGDFGIGMLDAAKMHLAMRAHTENPDRRFIRGNHDNPSACRSFPGYISDGTYFSKLDLFAVGGAWSIDKDERIPGWDWWPDEELSGQDFSLVQSIYADTKPRVMVTHDAPHSVLLQMFQDGTHKPIIKTQTSFHLQEMFEAHQPDYWIFGHWHLGLRENIEGTKFICLAELGHIDIDIGESFE